MKHLLLALMLAFLPIAATAQPFTEIVEIGAASGFDLEKAKADEEMKQELWTYLYDNRVAGIERGLIQVALSDAARARLEGASYGTSKQGDESPVEQVGVHESVGLTVAMGRETKLHGAKSARSAIGGMALTGDGEPVWTTSLQSPGATALRIHFTNVDLPADAALFLYNDEGQAHGPYTGKGPRGTGDFWSHTVFGDHAWVQLHYFNEDAAKLAAASFDIAAISHLGPGFELATRTQGFAKADCSANVACVVNVNCYTDQPLNTARKAMAKIAFETDDGSYVCSGGLLNDSDSSGHTPWFLTANHCIGTQDSADSMEAFFQYQSPCGSCSASYSESILGATLWARGPFSTGDYSLLELPELPASWGLMGMTTANIRESVGTELYVLSHPKGQPQSIAEHEVQTPNSSKPAMIIHDPTLGTNEKGSSGSPVFISGGLVVGVTSVFSGNTSDLCDPTAYETRSGAVSYFWKSVRPYLASPSGTYKMHVSAVAVSAPKIISIPFIGNLYAGRATVTVVDELGNVVPRVTVTGTFSNGLSGTFSGKTDENGEAVISHPALQPSKPSFTFCVTDLSQAYFNTYDAASNGATCASR